jgi:hypothetical protein
MSSNIPPDTDSSYNTLTASNTDTTHQAVALSTFNMAFILFIVLMIIGIFNYITILSTSSFGLITNIIKDATDNKVVEQSIINLSVLNHFGVFITIVISLFLVIFGIYYKGVLNGKQNKKAAGIIFLCIMSIMTITFILTTPIIKSFTNIVTIFENTIGYSVICLMYSKPIQSVLSVLFVNPEFKNTSIFPYSHTSYFFILSVLSIYNFSEIFSKLNKPDDNTPYPYDFYIDNSSPYSRKDDDPNIKKIITNINNGNERVDEIKTYIAKLIIMKYMIGHFCWIYFASIITCMVSIKFLVAHT